MDLEAVRQLRSFVMFESMGLPAYDGYPIYAQRYKKIPIHANQASGVLLTSWLSTPYPPFRERCCLCPFVRTTAFAHVFVRFPLSVRVLPFSLLKIINECKNMLF